MSIGERTHLGTADMLRTVLITSAIALASEHACAVLNRRQANGRDHMALQYKGVY